MGDAERALIQQHWNQVGGTLIEEYPAVRRGDEHGCGNIDAVIIKTDARQELDSFTEVPLGGQDVIVVQCKTTDWVCT